MVNKIKITNLFRNSPDGTIVACIVTGTITEGDYLVMSGDIALLISTIEKHPLYPETNLFFSAKELNGFEFSHSFIGKEFYVI